VHIEHGHAKRRWENFPAEGLTLKDLDRKEILRTRGPASIGLTSLQRNC